MKALQQPHYAGIVWLVLRVWLGYQWLASGIEKVFGEGSEAWVGSKAGSAVTGFLNGAVAKSPLNPDLDPCAGYVPYPHTITGTAGPSRQYREIHIGEWP